MIVGGVAHWAMAPTDTMQETTVGAALAQVAERHAHVDALRWVENGSVHALTYEELLRRATARAHEILDDVAPGEVVAIWAPNSVDWAITEYASALAGTVLVAINPALVDREVEYALRKSRAARLYTVAESRGKPLLARARALAERIDEVRTVCDLHADSGESSGPLPTVEPRSPFLIQFTSGTTGEPKAAVLSHRAAFNASRLYAELCSQPGERHVCCAPLPYHHVAGAVSRLVGTMAIAGTHVVVSSPDLMQLAEMTVACEVTHGGLLGKLAVDALESPDTLAAFAGHRMRTIGMGGSGIPPELIRRVEEAFGVAVVNGYGQSESPHIGLTVADDAPEDRWYTIGRPVPLRDVAILRGDGSIAEFGETGEICTRGPLVMDGYLDDPDKSAEVFAHGWLHTGDSGSMDDRGYLRYSGRAREMIIRGGENIYPAEVEARLIEHREILEVVIVPVPDARWGEQAFAFVRLAPGSALDATALREFARSVLAPFKVPAFWHVMDDFPRTALGKVIKTDLVTLAATTVGGEHASSSQCPGKMTRLC
jgi:fatty-acyl-CoA synthase